MGIVFFFGFVVREVKLRGSRFIFYLVLGREWGKVMFYELG